MKYLTQQDISFLQELSKKMNVQNNRATQFPMFVVKQKVKVYLDDDYCDKYERDEDYGGQLCESCQKLQDNNDELPEQCNSCPEEAFRWYTLEDKIVEECGSFFTAEEARKHIDENHYHYNEPFVYAIPSWRNKEMQRILNILSKLENGNAKSWYK